MFMEKNELMSKTDKKSFSNAQGEGNILRRFDAAEKDWRRPALSALVIVFIIAGGVISGYFLSQKSPAKDNPTTTKKINGNVEIVSGTREKGIKDSRVFRDSTQGRLEVNDFSQVDEGSFKLLRVGGKSQTVYLNSSVVNLSEFVGECVEVWGETFTGRKAGWLMDVGRVKVMDKCPKDL